MSTLELHGVTFERNFIPLFNPVYCQIMPGEIIHISGENGIGKSTLLRILAGLLEASSGTIYWQDKCILKNLEEYQQGLHYIGHHHGCKPYLTVLENILLFQALLSSKRPKNSVDESINLLGLEHLLHVKAALLSAGQLKRLSLIKLFLVTKKTWILDEPSTALDKQGQAFLQTQIEQHLAQKGRVILTTHLENLRPLPTKTLFLSRGN